MWAYFLKRMFLIVPTLIGITLVSFLIMQMVPGGPVEQALQRMRMAAQSEGGPGYSGALETAITSAELENIKKYYGFDQPVLTRYFRWLKNLFRLDLGTSYTYEKPVLEVIASRIPVSLTFGLTGLFLTYLVCIPLGIKKALKHGEAYDHWTSILNFVGYSIPAFALGVILIDFLAGGSFLSLFPTSGFVSDYIEDLTFIG